MTFNAKEIQIFIMCMLYLLFCHAKFNFNNQQYGLGFSSIIRQQFSLCTNFL
ncbi:hypothetical protein pb186bvf_004012 [Paramecium bursaria]